MLLIIGGGRVMPFSIHLMRFVVSLSPYDAKPKCGKHCAAKFRFSYCDEESLLDAEDEANHEKSFGLCVKMGQPMQWNCADGFCTRAMRYEGPTPFFWLSDGD